MQYSTTDLLAIALDRIEHLRQQVVSAKALATHPSQCADRIKACIDTTDGIAGVLRTILSDIEKKTT